MEFKETQCQGCKTKTSPLFMRANARSGNDTWCKPCMDAGKHTE